MKTPNPTSIRLPGDLNSQVAKLAASSGQNKTTILELAVRAGLPLLISGEYNPFSAAASSCEETPPTYTHSGKSVTPQPPPCAQPALTAGPSSYQTAPRKISRKHLP